MSGSQERSAPSQMSQHQHVCEGSVASADKKTLLTERRGRKKKTQLMISFSEMTFGRGSFLRDVLKIEKRV